MQNQGVTDPVQILADSKAYNDQQIGITIIGVGSDVDQQLLLNLATQGEGNYYFLQDEEKVLQVFVEELSFLVTVLARDLSILIQ
ncbi:MAG: hypothetical protein IIC61_08875, partial [Proteobacteria bacterium]|nr:hypothetical protein [Pseudomonadota bacterium]